MFHLREERRIRISNCLFRIRLPKRLGFEATTLRLKSFHIGSSGTGSICHFDDFSPLCFRHQAISLGEFTSASGESATLQEQIMQAKQEISAAETEIKTADLKIRDNTDQLKKKQLEMKKTEAEYKRDSGSLGTRLTLFPPPFSFFSSPPPPSGVWLLMSSWKFSGSIFNYWYVGTVGRYNTVLVFFFRRAINSFFLVGKFEAEIQQLEQRLGKINYVEGTSERLTIDQRQLRSAMEQFSYKKHTYMKERFFRLPIVFRE